MNYTVHKSGSLGTAQAAAYDPAETLGFLTAPADIAWALVIRTMDLDAWRNRIPATPAAAQLIHHMVSRCQADITYLTSRA